MVSAALPSPAADDFKPVPAEELALKDNPKQPGAHAMILEMTDDENDGTQSAVHYIRIKIFTEEGKKFANIELPYVKGITNVSDIKARTIHPDGASVPFTGTVYDKLVVKTKSLKFQAMTFSLPDVQPGSVIEYRYKDSWLGYGTTSWELQSDLFIRHAQFTLKPAAFRNYGMGYVAVGLASDDALQKKKDGSYSLQINDVPAFEEEEYAPPEPELKPHISFFYMRLGINTKENFWKIAGQEAYKEVDDFIGHRAAVQSAAAAVISPSDSVETKMKRLYDRVQQLKNLSFQREKTEQEAKRERVQGPKNVEDVWRLGYGYHADINRLYAAMLRAVGIDAEVVPTSQRDRYFFKPNLLSPNQLNRELVLVKQDGKELWLDPGTPLCPFGLLPWKVSGSEAYELNKEGGDFIKTPEPKIQEAVTRRVADLKLSSDGTAAGAIDVQFEGQDALSWRLESVTSDEAAIKSAIEDELKKMLPPGATVKLNGLENLSDEYRPLVAHFDVELPDLGSHTGTRTLLPLEIFRSNEPDSFASKKRVHPIYFAYPYLEVDTINLELPDSVRVEAIPEGKTKQADFGYYASSWSQQDKTLTMTRRMAVQSVLIDSGYQDVRSLFQQARAGDQENAVLQAAAK